MFSEFEVVIVGGGIAGLTTARVLLKKQPDLKIVVLEGKERVGGRTLTVDLPSGNCKTDKFDLGAQWVGRSQHETLELVHELGLELYDQYDTGKTVAVIGSTKIRELDEGDYSLIEQADFQLGIDKLNKLGDGLDIMDPYKWERAEWADGMSVAQWAKENSLTDSWKDALLTAIRTNFGIEAKRMSLLYSLIYCKSVGVFTDLIEVSGNGGQAFRIKGGTQQISEIMAADLGDRVRLGREVQGVETTEERTTVTLKGGKKLSARRCVLAIPPSQCNRISFSPSLGYHKMMFFQNSVPGHYIKFVVTFKSAFWREMNRSGAIISTGKTETPHELRPIACTYDATTPGGSAAIIGFAQNELHDVTLEQRKIVIMKDLERFFGPRVHEELIHYTDKDWSEEPLNGGCPIDYVTPGNMDSFVALRDPHIGVHFAGCETGVHWMGYMNGAIESGKRAASEVLLALGHTNKVDVKYLVPPRPRSTVYLEERILSRL